ncbi:acyl carrier protein [Peptoniphilus sp. oral taxon 386]|uniref:acyl carrier protein n=1 Tax=Peptoniphilus sp. oral taxon 386 TaxID=652713 RepID=UPI0001DA9D02|nr:acyl carrier protein [Peptoniphilus sp. oral taxon 386]EFI42474.1 putative acyl carrier protein [Peptoniphilus sp. oral taxon 386 str. F0131]
MNNLDKIKNIVAENLGCSVEELDENTNLIEDLKADSLDIVELTMAIEEEFGISIKDEDIEKINTIGNILEYVEK